MKTPNRSANVEDARRVLLDRIAAITTMQPGTLTEEWREPAGARGKDSARLGPYFKHQVWRDGRNVSRRVPAAEAARLREDLENARLYGQLTRELARLNIEHTLALRAAQAGEAGAGVIEGKKNSTRKRGSKNSPKPKPSSPGPGRP